MRRPNINVSTRIIRTIFSKTNSIHTIDFLFHSHRLTISCFFGIIDNRKLKKEVAMSVRLGIPEIARYLRLRFDLQHRLCTKAFRRIEKDNPLLEFTFTFPAEKIRVERLFDAASAIVAERFVKNEGLPLLFMEDLIDLLPDAESPTEEKMKNLSHDEQQILFSQSMFVRMVCYIVSQYQTEHASKIVRGWVQGILNVSRTFNMEPSEFVKLPDATDLILHTVCPTPESFLAMFGGGSVENTPDNRALKMAERSLRNFLDDEVSRLYGSETIN